MVQYNRKVPLALPFFFPPHGPSVGTGSSGPWVRNAAVAQLVSSSRRESGMVVTGSNPASGKRPRRLKIMGARDICRNLVHEPVFAPPLLRDSKNQRYTPFLISSTFCPRLIKKLETAKRQRTLDRMKTPVDIPEETGTRRIRITVVHPALTRIVLVQV